MLSRAYLNREWCRKELNAFLNAQGDSHTRVFVILIEDIPPGERGPQIEELNQRGSQFWEQHPDSDKRITRPLPTGGDAFDARIRELGQRIANRLETLKATTMANGERKSPLSELCVFVADGLLTPISTRPSPASARGWPTSRWLSSRRTGALYQLYYDDRTRCEEQFDEWLSQATLFVQPLGKRGDPDGFEKWLSDRALANGRAHARDLIQWRARELTAAEIPDANHRALVFDENVIRCDRDSELKPLIRDRLTELIREQRTAAHTGGLHGNVLLDADDADLQDKLLQELHQRDVGFHFVCNDLDEFREFALSGQFDGFVVTYGQTDQKWLSKRFSSTRTLWLSSSPRPRIGVYRAPDNQQPLPTKTETLHDIASVADLDEFIDKVREVAQ